MEGPKDRVCARSYLSPLGGYFVGPPPADPYYGLLPLLGQQTPTLLGRASAAVVGGVTGSGYTCPLLYGARDLC